MSRNAGSKEALKAIPYNCFPNKSSAILLAIGSKRLEEM